MTNEKSARDWAIFMNINDERYSDVERMTAIEHIAYAPTHNSITKAMMLDVIRYLLTAKQPRVLTLEEFQEMKEPLDGESICYEIMQGNGAVLKAMLVKTFSTCEHLYNKAFRVWNVRPTDEQREATPWDEPPKEGDSECEKD